MPLQDRWAFISILSLKRHKISYTALVMHYNKHEDLPLTNFPFQKHVFNVRERHHADSVLDKAVQKKVFLFVRHLYLLIRHKPFE